MSHYSNSRQATFSEVLGMVVGGGAVVAVLSAQVLFLAWVI